MLEFLFKIPVVGWLARDLWRGSTEARIWILGSLFVWWILAILYFGWGAFITVMLAVVAFLFITLIRITAGE